LVRLNFRESYRLLLWASVEAETFVFDASIVVRSTKAKSSSLSK